MQYKLEVVDVRGVRFFKYENLTFNQLSAKVLSGESSMKILRNDGACIEFYYIGETPLFAFQSRMSSVLLSSEFQVGSHLEFSAEKFNKDGWDYFVDRDIS